MSPGHAWGIVQEGAGRRQRPREWRHRAQVRLALVLAGVAGFVDAVGFILLFGAFTAQMSGNSVRLGVFLGQNDWSDALFRLVPVPAFVLGILAGILLAEAAARSRLQSRLALLVGIEVALIGAFMVAAWPHYQDGVVRVGSRIALYGFVALLAAAMGVQTAALQRAGRRPVRTTYITGMLTDLASELAHLISRSRRLSAVGSTAPGAGAGSPWHAAFLGSLWVAYVGGAALGSLAEGHWHVGGLFPALAVLVLVMGLDLAAPVSDPAPAASGAGG